MIIEVPGWSLAKYKLLIQLLGLLLIAFIVTYVILSSRQEEQG